MEEQPAIYQLKQINQRLSILCVAFLFVNISYLIMYWIPQSLHIPTHKVWTLF